MRLCADFTPDCGKLLFRIVISCDANQSFLGSRHCNVKNSQLLGTSGNFFGNVNCFFADGRIFAFAL